MDSAGFEDGNHFTVSINGESLTLPTSRGFYFVLFDEYLNVEETRVFDTHTSDT